MIRSHTALQHREPFAAGAALGAVTANQAAIPAARAAARVAAHRGLARTNGETTCSI